MPVRRKIWALVLLLLTGVALVYIAVFTRVWLTAPRTTRQIGNRTVTVVEVHSQQLPGHDVVWWPAFFTLKMLFGYQPIAGAPSASGDVAYWARDLPHGKSNTY